MGLHAITDNATGCVLEWGGEALREAAGGETAYVGTIDDASQAIIDSVSPKYTKVVALAFVEMTSGEKTAVDAVMDPADASERIDSFLALLDDGVVHDYGDVGVNGIEIDMDNGLEQKLKLTGAPGVDKMTVSLPTNGGSRKVTLEIEQGAGGPYAIAGTAWKATDFAFGDKGAPTFAEAVGKLRFLQLHFRKGDTFVRIHYDTNFF